MASSLENPFSVSEFDSPRSYGRRIVPQMSARFYLNWPLTPGPVEMGGPEARHLATVCRFRAGDRLCLFNGDGHEYAARIASVSKKSVHLDIEAKTSPHRELDFRLTIAAPIPKGDRAQFLVEKLTEMGVTAFIPLVCERTVVEPRGGKIDKLERYVIEASKQCGRNVLMRIEPATDWATYCGRAKKTACAYWLTRLTASCNY